MSEKIDTDATVTEIKISQDQLETIQRILGSNVMRAVKKYRLLELTGLKHLLCCVCGQVSPQLYQVRYVVPEGGAVMTELHSLYQWLENYIHTYYTDDKFIMERVQLKEVHSKRVADSIANLAKSEKLTARQQTLAEVIGLFHDIARFRQVTEYRTFVDAESFDHGTVGAEILTETGILRELFSLTEQDAITFAIMAHNKMLIPPTTPENELFAKLIRDADKLDIFRILPPIQADHNYAPKLIEQLKTGGVLSYTDVKSLADKRLIRLSWFYDINFDWTLRLLVEEGHLDRQLAALPDNPDTRVIKATVKKYIANRLKN
jgi:HD superfamily phosphohydrolase YqeK